MAALVPRSPSGYRHKVLNDILIDSFLARLFEQFCRKTFCRENLEFVYEIRKFRQLTDPQQLKKESARIYVEYFAKSSQKEINIDHKIRSALKDKLRNPEPTMFDDACEAIYRILETDTMKKFIESDFYKKASTREVTALADYRPVGDLGWRELELIQGQVLKFLKSQRKVLDDKKKKKAIASQMPKERRTIGESDDPADYWAQVVTSEGHIGWVPACIVEERPGPDGNVEAFIKTSLRKRDSMDLAGYGKSERSLTLDGYIVEHIKMILLDALRPTKLIGSTFKPQEDGEIIAECQSIIDQIKDATFGIVSGGKSQFSGAKLAAWMVQQNIVNNRVEARRIGQRLLDNNLLYSIDSIRTDTAVSSSAAAQAEDNAAADDIAAGPVASSPAAVLTFRDSSDLYKLRDIRWVQLAAQMIDPHLGVDIRDRKYKLKKYPRTFVGNEAVQWLCSTQPDTDPVKAVLIGNVLIEQGIICNAVDPTRGFGDDSQLYRFRQLYIKVDPVLIRLAVDMSDPTNGVPRSPAPSENSTAACFKGRNAVDWLLRRCIITTHDEMTRDWAAKVCVRLLYAGFMTTVGPAEHAFEDSNKLFAWSTDNIQAWKQVASQDRHVEEVWTNMSVIIPSTPGAAGGARRGNRLSGFYLRPGADGAEATPPPSSPLVRHEGTSK